MDVKQIIGRLNEPKTETQLTRNQRRVIAKTIDKMFITLKDTSGEVVRTAKKHVELVLKKKISHLRWLTIKSPMGTGKSFALTFSDPRFPGLLETVMQTKTCDTPVHISFVLVPQTDNLNDVLRDLQEQQPANAKIVALGGNTGISGTKKGKPNPLWLDELSLSNLEKGGIICVMTNKMFQQQYETIQNHCLQLKAELLEEYGKELRTLCVYDEFHWGTVPQSDDPTKQKEIGEAMNRHMSGQYRGMTYNALVKFNDTLECVMIGLTATPHPFISADVIDPTRGDLYDIERVTANIKSRKLTTKFIPKVANGLIDIDGIHTWDCENYDDYELGIEVGLLDLWTQNAMLKVNRDHAQKTFSNAKFAMIKKMLSDRSSMIFCPSNRSNSDFSVRFNINAMATIVERCRKKFSGKEVTVQNFFTGQTVTVKLDTSGKTLRNFMNDNNDDITRVEDGKSFHDNTQFVNELETGESDVGLMVLKGRMGISVCNLRSIINVRPNKGKAGVELMIVQTFGRLNRSTLPSRVVSEINGLGHKDTYQSIMWEEVPEFFCSEFPDYASVMIELCIEANTKTVFTSNSERNSNALHTLCHGVCNDDALMMSVADMKRIMETVIDIGFAYDSTLMLKVYKVQDGKLFFRPEYEVEFETVYSVNLGLLEKKSYKDTMYTSISLNKLKNYAGVDNINEVQIEVDPEEFPAVDGDNLHEIFNMQA
jgi:hypothetical protein